LLEWHVPAIQDIYRVRRDAMIAALDQHMPAGVRRIRPEGGMFTWVMLPEHVDANELFHTAIEHDVAFVPGPFLYARGGGNHSMRLNFSLPTPEQIEEGIRRLGCSIRAMM
jgi:2-aminoadipate transaminase